MFKMDFLAKIVIFLVTFECTHYLGDACRAHVKTLVLSEHCNKSEVIEAPVQITLTKHQFGVLGNCLHCSLTFTTRVENQLVASLTSLGTDTEGMEYCNLYRFDVFDGPSSNGTLLSGKNGICGCKFPAISEFKSTGNAMTVRLKTVCNSSITQHAELKLIVSSVKNDLFNRTECKGEFKCDSGQCLDKNLVCNGHADCPDRSDETNCTTRNGTCPGEFECKDGACIDKNLVCNGHNDCPDHSDEVDCRSHVNVTCLGKFECKNGRCLDKNDVCNGKNDCGDNSDEVGCHSKHRLLLYILIGVAGLALLVLVIILIVVCCKYCCITMATDYRRI